MGGPFEFRDQADVEVSSFSSFGANEQPLTSDFRTRERPWIEETDVKIEIPGSTTHRLEIDLPTGEYRYHCDVVGHDSV